MTKPGTPLHLREITLLELDMGMSYLVTTYIFSVMCITFSKNHKKIQNMIYIGISINSHVAKRLNFFLSLIESTTLT